MLLDATSLPAERLGAAHYVLGLLGGLSRLDDVVLHVVAKRADAVEIAAVAPKATVHPVAQLRRPTRLVWEQTMLPARVRRIAPDVFHGPHYTLPAALPCPGVVTFHDPTFFTHPHLHERAKIAYFTRMARLTAGRAARIVAISRYAADGAVRFAGADVARLDVVHHGIDADVYRPAAGDEESSDRELREGLGVAGRYVFWVGAIEPRKDVPSLVSAFERLPDDVTLVLAGRRAWGASEVDAAVERCRAGERIVRPGYITTQEKIALYRGAAALCYPSIAEGFGLQVLEAMACGCPVVTTSGSAPEEIGGDAVDLASPGDVDALAGKLQRLLDDEALRTTRIAAGVERAAGFTWEACARATADSYRRAAGS